VLAGTGGFGLIAHIGDLVGRQKAGKTFLSLEGDEKPLPPSPVPAALVGLQLACLSLQGRLLTYALDELKHQPKGGRGLTLIDLEPKDALLSVAAFGQTLQVLGSGRGGKPKEELLKGAALAAYAGKRARKGRAVEGMVKVARVLAG
jgi:topoisomerase-4 subunit A